ncbi:thioesterase family protein [Acinetobacter stercoris]|uniref:Thioesterase family protein n=1 Tax=Acinetobacter stercoris TaxID=2126983 RepID=A0A2U3N377_9GAMM|nr:thioesterase family protein [Acinetobacter stercoris]SPL72131.1 hypothetical protein KPC_3309 [Acinetobacter stercoris]
MSAYYKLISRIENLNETITHYQSNIHAQGAWNPHEQHMAPASGLMCKELERFYPRENMRIGRISFDIFGLIHAGEFSIHTRVIRAGKTIELIESEMKTQGKTSIVARAWRMLTTDTSSVAGLEDQTIQNPEHYPEWDGLKKCWSGGFIESTETRADDTRRNGKGIVWQTTNLEMVEGEQTSDFVRILGIVDTANGIVPRQNREFDWAFPNLDLQIHMHRLPQGKWLGLEAIQQYGSDGIGLTSAVLHDIYGPFGRSEQILTIRPMTV